MCPTTSNQPDEEELMRRYISEAGNPHVLPSAEHVAGLRSLLLKQLAPPRRIWNRKVRLLAGPAVVALLIFIAWSSLGRPVTVMAEVIQALRGKTWIHASMVSADGHGEGWFSPSLQLGALRSDHEFEFHDYKRKIFTKYVAAERAVYLLPERLNGPDDQNFLRPLLNFLLDPKGAGKFPFPGLELINQTQREITEGTKTTVEIELKLRYAGGSRGEPLSMRIRVDPVTHLPDSLVTDDLDGGGQLKGTFDYPERGPSDIYSLGVPRAVNVVERLVSQEVNDVLKKLKAGRRQFDDYMEFVVEKRIRPDNYRPMTNVYRVWRKGSRWRIDHLRQGLEWTPPADSELAWWKEYEHNLTFVPKAICNGKEYWEYYLLDDWRPGMSVPQPGMPNASDIVSGPNPLAGPDDDPQLPFWSQDLLLEQAAHPTYGVFFSENCELVLESTPADSPPGTILLRGRNTSSDAAYIDHFRLSLDPAASFLAMTCEMKVRDSSDRQNYDTQIHLIEAAAKSPEGHFYPLQTHYIGHYGTHELVRSFFVDFEAQIPDELFEPLK